MSTDYLYGTILTGEGVAANNRGDNIGNTTTLQKVFHQDDLHTSVSAEAIRFALRYRFQLEGLGVNRSYDPEAGKLNYEDEKREKWNPDGDVFIDDDLMGFMDAAAAKQEREEEETVAADETAEDQKSPTAKNTKKPKPKGKTAVPRLKCGQVSLVRRDDGNSHEACPERSWAEASVACRAEAGHPAGVEERGAARRSLPQIRRERSPDV